MQIMRKSLWLIYSASFTRKSWIVVIYFVIIFLIMVNIIVTHFYEKLWEIIFKFIWKFSIYFSHWRFKCQNFMKLFLIAKNSSKLILLCHTII